MAQWDQRHPWMQVQYSAPHPHHLWQSELRDQALPQLWQRWQLWPRNSICFRQPKKEKRKRKKRKKQKKDDSQDSGFSTSVPKSESTRGKWTLIKHGATNSILDISFGTWSIQVEMFSPQLTYELGVQRNVAWSYICNN